MNIGTQTSSLPDSSDSSASPAISPFALLVRKDLRLQKLKMNITLTSLVPMRLKLLLEKNLTNKQDLVLLLVF